MTKARPGAPKGNKNALKHGALHGRSNCTPQVNRRTDPHSAAFGRMNRVRKLGSNV